MRVMMYQSWNLGTALYNVPCSVLDRTRSHCYFYLVNEDPSRSEGTNCTHTDCRHFFPGVRPCGGESTLRGLGGWMCGSPKTGESGHVLIWALEDLVERTAGLGTH
jgi:hypothetical protein